MNGAGAATVGGEPVVTLAVTSIDDRSSFVRAEVLPGCGMMILQLVGRTPSLGEFDMLASPPLERARDILESDRGASDSSTAFPANVAFSMGDAILAPFANRIGGTRSRDGTTITTRIAERTVTLPANWGGKAPGAERYAMHGLLLGARVRDVQRETTKVGDVVRARYDAGDFGGYWPSRTILDFDYSLTSGRFEITVRATNDGNELLPMGIGSHPYFRIPSGDRTQARLHVPARLRALVNDYDEVLPTGELQPVRDTPYDYTAPGGHPLGNAYLDDCFTDLLRNPNGDVVCRIIDPASRFELRVIGESPAIAAVQLYAPPNEAYIALEPQFNLADPFGSEWSPGIDTGMVLLSPGESADYRVAFEMSAPDE